MQATKVRSSKSQYEEGKLVGMGLRVHQAEGQGKKLAPFQDVD